jgi:hypothetical protein
MAHLDAWKNGARRMVDPTETEAAGMSEAGIAGYEYLQSINKVTVTDMTDDEWKNFIDAICTTYTGYLRNNPDCPF